MFDKNLLVCSGVKSHDDYKYLGYVTKQIK